ncbi:MAG TPA: guanylate kinase [Polyangiaceae bacterium]|nr:guanylate kinase [Polyangiaceae bacterium]
MSNDEPLQLIISSPSGAGKSTLTARLIREVGDLRFSVSHTTRRPRETELNGREYHFVDRTEFEALIEAGAFLEWAEVHGNLYGTSRSEIQRSRAARGIIFDIDHQGARQIKSCSPDAVAVFILPPSMRVLEERLRGRRSEDDATVRRRFDAAREEIAHYGLFDYVLVNDDLEEATRKLTSIFLAEECRRARASRYAERLLAEGRGFGGTLPPGRPPRA